MGEVKALVLFMAVLVSLLCGVTAILIGIGADGAIVGLVGGLFIVTGGYFSGAIVTHYAELKQRHKREETLLSG